MIVFIDSGPNCFGAVFWLFLWEAVVCLADIRFAFNNIMHVQKIG